MIGTARPLAQPARDLEAVEVGQAEVEQDQVRASASPPRRSASCAVRGLDHAVAVAAEQRAAQEAQHLRLVLDDQHERRGPRRSIGHAALVPGIAHALLLRRRPRAARPAAAA